jgi:hypothetical protein
MKPARKQVPISALGHRRTSRYVHVMSALPPKADIVLARRRPPSRAQGDRDRRSRIDATAPLPAPENYGPSASLLIRKKAGRIFLPHFIRDAHPGRQDSAGIRHVPVTVERAQINSIDHAARGAADYRIASASACLHLQAHEHQSRGELPPPFPRRVVAHPPYCGD